MMIRKWMALLAAAVLLLTAGAAVAEEPAGPDFDQVPEFLFRNYKDGIGLGPCPIYTAPNTELGYRVGRATCDTDSRVYVAGRDASGWLLVRYATNDKGARVGYIPHNNLKGFKADNNLSFSYITCEAPFDIAITDNPLDAASSFAVIPQGGVYAILAKYTYYGDWWYVETKIDGLYARGFIPRTTQLLPTERTVVEIPDMSAFPEASPEGEPLQGTVTVIGDACLVRKDAGTDFEWVARAKSYDIFPYYGTKTGTNNHPWYHVCVDGVWGWIAGPLVRPN